jgi:NAD(P)H dehydrogenase (quinone)
MIAVVGITGQVGGKVARLLLEKGEQVRAVVRTAEKGIPWAQQGCEIAVADLSDPVTLTSAFAGVQGVFLMTPPNYDPEPGFPQTIQAATAIKQAVLSTKPGRLVFLSTVGAQRPEPNLLNNSKITEEMLRTLPTPVAILRAAWFMENASWDLESARTGAISSFLQPLDHAIPMVASDDIASTAADLLLANSWEGLRTIELEAERRYSANDIARTFSDLLGHPVVAKPVPHDSWDGLFRAQGMKNPLPRIQMLDGFNQGWIDFERNGTESRTGRTNLKQALGALIERGES